MSLTLASATVPMTVNAENTMYGDVDCDGALGISDYLALNRFLRGQVDLANMKNADVNDNGFISKADCSILLDYMVGTLTELPYNGN